MSDNKIIKWWKYPSIWKFLGTILATMLISLICALFLPEIWNVASILAVCIVGGIFMRKFFPDAIIDFMKEMSS